MFCECTAFRAGHVASSGDQNGAHAACFWHTPISGTSQLIFCISRCSLCWTLFIIQLIKPASSPFPHHHNLQLSALPAHLSTTSKMLYSTFIVSALVATATAYVSCPSNQKYISTGGCSYGQSCKKPSIETGNYLCRQSRSPGAASCNIADSTNGNGVKNVGH